MTKLIIVFGLILSLGGVAFAQGESPPEGGMPGGPGGPPGEGTIVPDQGMAPEQGAVSGERTIVDVLRKMFPQATIEVDPVSSTLIVKAPPSLQKKIEKMIKRLDVYHPQVTIEAKFVELTVTDINELGVNLDIPNIKTGPSDGNVDVISNWADSDAGFPNESAGTSFWITRLNDTAFNALLRALEKQKKVNVLSAPRVTTVNGQPATIEVTQNIPYVSQRSIQNVGTSEYPIWQTNYTIAQDDAGVYLEVTPTVPEGSTLITLDLKPTVKVLVKRITVYNDVEAGYGWPVVDTRTTNTSMVVRSGESIVLGGLIHDSTEVIEKKVPILGSIPFLGRAFQYKYSSKVKKNLLIFITAYLVSPRGERIGAGGTS